MLILKRFASFPRADQSLLIEAALFVGVMRAGLLLFPLQTVQRIARKIGKRSKGVRPADRIPWAVSAVSRYLPGSTCLTQALAAQALLARSGYVSRVEIGVAKDEERRFEAHAWLVFQEQVVIGGPKVERYTALPAWPGRP
jgi:hypothetical protein